MHSLFDFYSSPFRIVAYVFTDHRQYADYLRWRRVGREKCGVVVVGFVLRGFRGWFAQWKPERVYFRW
jgi:hypothetical protein